MWKAINDSVAGTSHHRTDTVCQDASFVTAWQHENESFLILACADGAGSAAKSEIGSKLACKSVGKSATEFFEAGGRLGDGAEEVLRKWIVGAREEIEAEATGLGVAPRALACTLLLAIVGEQAAWFAQIGDGAIVSFHEDEYHPVFWPQAGQYPNETFFLTDSEYKKNIQSETHAHRIDEIAMFSDGLQTLALNFATKSAHQPFFSPMFDALRQTVDPTDLNVPLITFLNSEAINDRTDDDKTLILATRINTRGDTVL